MLTQKCCHAILDCKIRDAGQINRTIAAMHSGKVNLRANLNARGYSRRGGLIDWLGNNGTRLGKELGTWDDLFKWISDLRFSERTRTVDDIESLNEFVSRVLAVNSEICNLLGGEFENVMKRAITAP
jgi:hypothetical protein